MSITTKKKVWRGLDLKRLRKLEHALQMMIDRDYKAAVTAKANQNLFFFIEEGDTDGETARDWFVNRIASCKAAKA